MPPTFPFDPRHLPPPSDPERAERGIARLHDAAARAKGEFHTRFVRALLADPGGRALAGALFGNSPYLTDCLTGDLAFAERLITLGPDEAYTGLMAGATRVAATRVAATRVAATHVPATHVAVSEVGAQLRRLKRQAALAVAIGELTGVWSIDTAAARLSAFADAALHVAVRTLLADSAARGAFTPADPADPTRGSGLFILAMGKLGAFELNYSSDVDLIILFDEDDARIPDAERRHRTYVRLARALVKMMDERTAQGYVFRTDLRLRPDPGATPLALSTLAAETYYESTGQNWERAAMIKARPAAGDRAAGRRFLATLKPFIWRRHLDFAAIADIQSIKRQIHAHKGGSQVIVAGHDVKLGRGGIREIEFFAQTQQLIWGGRDPSLRCPATLDALDALRAAGHVDDGAAKEMTAAYRFLRRVEQRLQMVDDRQTHALPDSEAGLAAFATFMGYRDQAEFARDTLRHLRVVESRYAELFEKTPSLGGRGSLVFTGGEDHPETLETLGEMGFHAPARTAAMVRAWHRGRYRATRSQRAREILTELVPAILEALGRTAQPDAALARFDRFLAALPAGVQLFSLFQANPSLLSLVADIMGGAPRLAEWLGKRPLLLDGVLAPDFTLPLADADGLAEDLDKRLAVARDPEDTLEIARIWANDAKFRVGVQMLHGVIDVDHSGRALAAIAEAVIRAILPRIETVFAARHGRCPGDGLAVVALGKLGARELTARSDLDLVLVYDAPDGADAGGSDGPRPLPYSQYYLMLSQRLVTALSAPTAEGRLYEVDVRLRPSGAAGPLATSIDAFARYHAESAWTWEAMALTRARVVAGAPALAERIEDAIQAALSRPRDPSALVMDVARMRARIERQHATDNPFRIKYIRGGLIDCEFIAQYMQLRHAHTHAGVRNRSTAAAFEALGRAGLMAAGAAEELAAATRLWLRLQGLLRLTMAVEATPEAMPAALQASLAAAAGAPSFAALLDLMTGTAATVSGHFARLIDRPAAEARAQAKQHSH